MQEGERSLCERRAGYGINQSAETWPHLSGSWADEIYLQPGSTVVRLPEGTTAEQVIALGCAGPTVGARAARDHPAARGDVVVVQGAGPGPVGLASAMYAKLAGAAKVVIVGAPRSRLDLALELGVCEVAVDIFKVPSPDERRERVLAETTAGRGADLVVEATGAPQAVGEGFDLCRKNARYLVVGQYTDHGPVPLNPHLITRSSCGCSVRGP